jgi:hypothetical protein
MGCDFDLIIEVLYYGKWVPIVFFGTKTSCYGFPLTTATFKLYQETNIHGDYKRKEERLSKDVDVVQFILGLSETDRMTFANKLPVAEEEKEVWVIERSEESETEYQEYLENKSKSFLYYSLSEFQKLVNFIQPLGEPQSDQDHLYINMMTPVPLWMNLAKSSLPFTGRHIWMEQDTEHIDETTRRITEKRKELKKVFFDLLLVLPIWPGNFPYELVDMVAEFALPVGDDVRIAWYDDEQQCKTLMEYQSPQKSRKVILLIVKVVLSCDTLDSYST